MYEAMQNVKISSEWTTDDSRPNCVSCHKEFNALLNRRHHCRLCGDVFCDECSNQKALIPPRDIVLQPKGGKKVGFHEHKNQVAVGSDPDRRVTFTKEQQKVNVGNVNQQQHDEAQDMSKDMKQKSFPELDEYYIDDDLLSVSVQSSSGLSYGTLQQNQSRNEVLCGNGLEERMKLAREPLRVCRYCYKKLSDIQDDLRNTNSNAVQQHNMIDPAHFRRLLNSPLSFSMEHDIRKAAYTLHNLLPLPKRLSSFIPINDGGDLSLVNEEQCQDVCQGVGGMTFGNLDGIRIPVKLLERAKGLVILTSIKLGCGALGFEFGTGLAISRLDTDTWSAPSSIGCFSAGVGSMAGCQVCDHIFLLMSDEAVDIMTAKDGSVQLGGDIAIAVGPVGRAAEADVSMGKVDTDGVHSRFSMSQIYSYSQSKGLYIGISLAGRRVFPRNDINQKFYGAEVDSIDLLTGIITPPTAAQPLYDALSRCHTHAG